MKQLSFAVEEPHEEISSRCSMTALVIWPFKIVHYYQRWNVIFKACAYSCYIWDDDVLNVPDYGFLIGPVPWWMGNIPIRRKLIVGMTVVGFLSIYHLHWKEISSEGTTKYSGDQVLIVDSGDFHSVRTLSVHCASAGWHNLDSCLIPVKYCKGLAVTWSNWLGCSHLDLK